MYPLMVKNRLNYFEPLIHYTGPYLGPVLFRKSPKCVIIKI